MEIDQQAAGTYEPHVGQSRPYWRDIILGVNDGLVSILLLVAGVVGGGLSPRQVLLTGISGAIAGAVSMGAGEYLATKSQDQVLESEVALERVHIREHRSMELGQLRDMFAEMGVRPEDLEGVVAAFDRSDKALLNAMKALEFGVVESERRSPYRAMAFAGLLFLAGSLPVTVPFAFVDTAVAGLAWAAVLTMAGLFGVGIAKSAVTKGNPWLAGAENLVIAGLGGLVAFGVGRLVGANLA